TRNHINVDRQLLTFVLKKQYSSLGIDLPVSEETLLSDHTFTITTAHQPTLLTGALFHIYKIASVIHLTESLQTTYPEYQFLPVFIVSGEDHDWAEVNHVYQFGKKYEWVREASGPVGRLSTEGLEDLINSVSELFKNTPYGHELDIMLHDCLSNASTYNEFHFLLIHALFGHRGLIILNPDDADLKKSFVPIMEKEILDRFSYKAVTEVQSELEKEGFKVQAFCRPINLFYLTEGKRERIDVSGDHLVRVDTGIKYTPEELINELQHHPEQFSPNVILRPLYQEFILPNLAYIGGGGELAYWIDRKKQFEVAGVPYPMLIRRNSLLLIEPSVKSHLDKLGLRVLDLMMDSQQLIKSFLKKNSQTDLSYDEELKQIENAYRALSDKAHKIDPTLSKSILAEENKQVKAFEHLGSRLLRAEKQQQENQVKKIERLKEKISPGGGLQERQENFMAYYATYGRTWIDNMIRICDPLVEKFIIVELPQ
ncbi:MAG: bacillithiol biosynthesis cysteine-adding enzyme BshC, partial [Bacteroidota bacterium]|nr:bacillithiol biosynthesis cysteine-adding enzyme BshC [Bacteroidota bacterium]